jgi:predicted nucleic acid-binding protein
VNVLVDTSVWSLALRRQAHNLNPPQLQVKVLLTSLISDGRVNIIGAIRQELLSGIRGDDQLQKVREHLAVYPDLQMRTSDYERAAEMSNSCTSHGISNTPTDMLICSVAHGNGLAILTTDRDFKGYARCLPINLISAGVDAEGC